MEYCILTCVCVRDVCVCECVLHDFVYNALGHPKPAHRETPRAQLSSAGVVASGTWSASGQRADLFAAPNFGGYRNTGIPIPGSPHSSKHQKPTDEATGFIKLNNSHSST